MHHEGFRNLLLYLEPPIIFNFRWFGYCEKTLQISVTFQLPLFYVNYPVSLWLDYANAMRKQGIEVKEYWDDIPF